MTDAIHANRLGAHRRIVGRNLLSSIEQAATGGIGPVSIASIPPVLPTPSFSIPTLLPGTSRTTDSHSSKDQTTTSPSTTKTSSATSTSSSTSSEAKPSSSSSSTSKSSSSASSSSSSSLSSSSHSSSVTSSTQSSTSLLTPTSVVSTPVISTPPVVVTSSYVPTYAPISSIIPTGAAASPSSTGSASGVSTGAVVGGIAAGLAGVAGVLFAIIYFWRRSHSNHDDGGMDDFNARAFKAQSVILPDEGMPSRSGSFNRGGNDGYDPRSPSMMMEQTMADVPMAFGAAQGMHQDYGTPGGYYNNNSYPSQLSYAPGQYMSTAPGQGPQLAANPFVAPYGQVPVGAPLDGSPYDFAYQAQGLPLGRQTSNGSPQYMTRQPSRGPAQNLARQPSSPMSNSYRQPSDAARPNLYSQPSDLAAQLLSRQPSNGAAQQLAQQSVPGVPAAEVTVGPDPHYVDLNRSSVTPFQAAQYSEISRRLNIASPAPNQGLEPVVEDGASPDYSVHQGSLNEKQLPGEPAPQYTLDHESPFADSQEAQEVTIHQNEHSGMYTDVPDSAPSYRDSFAPLPSPYYENHSRIPSNAPVLPEIQLQQRSFSSMSTHYPSVPSAKPSPLGATFALPSPPPEAHVAQTPTTARPPSIGASTAGPQASIRHTEGPALKRPETVYTLYDDDDAYSGI